MGDLAAEGSALCELVTRFPAVPVGVTSTVLAGYLGAGMTLFDALRSTQERLADACSAGDPGQLVALGGLRDAEDAADPGHVQDAHDLSRDVA